MNSQDRKVYLITGGSEGIGLAVAKLASAYANVLLVARDTTKLEKALTELQSGNHSYLSADLSRPGEAKRVIEETVSRYGRLDGLVNSAGIFLEKPFTQCSPEELNRVFALNFTATLEACHAALPHMERQNSGIIVNISSMAGIKTYRNEAAYGTSKAAVNKLSEQLFSEYQGTPIRVYALAPGSVDTPLLRKALEPQRDFFEKEIFKDLRAENGARFSLDDYFARILTAEQVAKRALDLLSKPNDSTEPVVILKSFEF